MLAVVPLIQAGIELIVSPVTISDFVERRVGPSTTLVEMDGYALLVPFPAGQPGQSGAADGAADGPAGWAYQWYAVRDSVEDRRVALVRSPLTVDALRTRTLIARVVDDPAAVSRALEALARRGVSTVSISLPLLDEVDEPTADIRVIDSVTQLAEVAAGDLVRIRLEFGPGVATCVAADTCVAQRLADGIGSWDNLASDPTTGQPVVVRTAYPPSVAPFRGVGQQAANPGEVEAFLESAPARGLLGWARVLRGAHVEHDIGLPIDRLWLGPILFGAVAALLFAGLWIGYPRFRLIETGTRRLGGVAAGSMPALGVALPAVASGRITPHGASPFEVTDAPAALLASAETGTTILSLQVEDAERRVVVPPALGGLGSIELGELVEIRSNRAALRVGWFGSQVLLVFDSPAARDAAAAMVRGPREP